MEHNVELIPVIDEIAQEFEEKMGRSVLYRSSDNFMALYNNELINRNNDEIDSVAKEIEEIYKNVTLVNRKFYVKTREEVVSEEFEVLFPHISFIATLKRVAGDILKDNNPEDTLMVFNEEKQNYVHIYDPSTDELKEYEGAERIPGANKAISTNPFLNSHIDMNDFGDDGISFKAIDVMHLDTSFINNIGNLLNEYVQ